MAEKPENRRVVIPFSLMNNLHAQLLLWIPTIGFWFILDGKKTWAPCKFDGCSWDFPPSPIEAAPSCVMKDILAEPNYARYSLGIFAAVFTAFLYKNNARQLKQLSFALAMVLAIVLQCLSTFSGYVSSSSLYWLPFAWNFYARPMWLWFLIECAAWNWSYLGTYEDYHLRPGSRNVIDEIGNTVWMFTSVKTGDAEEDEFYDPHSPHFLPWQDVTVRLAYLQLLDSICHALWLRYGYKYAPYTTYINNFEILAFLLFVCLALFTYARGRTHLVFTEDDHLCSDTKHAVPLSEHSVTRNLLTLSSPSHDFRKPSSMRQLAVFSAVLFATLILATLHTWMAYVWLVLAKLVVGSMLKKWYKTQGYTNDEAADLAMRDQIAYHV